jgi:hypothetical protein
MGRVMTMHLGGPGPRDLAALSARLKTADARLRRDVRKALARQAEPLVRKVQRSAMEIPAEHDPDGSLRAAIARTIAASITYPRRGVRVTIVSRGSRMPAGQENLPAYTNRPQGWRHPVYARGPRRGWTWREQTSGRAGWFERPIEASRGEIKRDLERALDETARYLDGRGL